VSARFDSMCKDEHLTVTRYFYTVFVVSIPVWNNVGLSEEQTNTEYTQQKRLLSKLAGISRRQRKKWKLQIGTLKKK